MRLQVAGGQGARSQVLEVHLCPRPLQMRHTAQLLWLLQPPRGGDCASVQPQGPGLRLSKCPLQPVGQRLSGKAAPTACGPPCGPRSSHNLTRVLQPPRRPHSPGRSVSGGERSRAWKPHREARGRVPVKRESGGKLRGQCWAQVGVGDRASRAEEAADAKALRLGDLPGATEQVPGSVSAHAPDAPL